MVSYLITIVSSSSKVDKCIFVLFVLSCCLLNIALKTFLIKFVHKIIAHQSIPTDYSQKTADSLLHSMFTALHRFRFRHENLGLKMNSNKKFRFLYCYFTPSGAFCTSVTSHVIYDVIFTRTIKYCR